MIHVAFCKGCGLRFQPKASDRMQYHSRECAFDTKTRIAKERAWIRAMHHTAMAALVRDQLVDCSECADAFIVPQSNRKWQRCPACTKKRLAQQGREANRRKRGRPIECFCIRCGEPTHRLGTYCTSCKRLIARANKKRGKIARRYRIASSQTQTIIDVEQFMRDDWKCQRCGSTVDQVPPIDKDKFAHLDHIIPLSKGGQHIWSNVQTLCRKCNLDKSDEMPVVGDPLCLPAI